MHAPNKSRGEFGLCAFYQESRISEAIYKRGAGLVNAGNWEGGKEVGKETRWV